MALCADKLPSFSLAPAVIREALHPSSHPRRTIALPSYSTDMLYLGLLSRPAFLEQLFDLANDATQGGLARTSENFTSRNCLIIPERPRRGPPRGLRMGPGAPFGRIRSHRMQGLEAALTIYQTVSLRGWVSKVRIGGTRRRRMASCGVAKVK